MKKFAASYIYIKRVVQPFIFLCLCLALLSSCSSKKSIVNGLDEKEANEIIVFLAGKNIEANKVQQVTAGGGGAAKAAKYDIVVDMDKATEAMGLLNQAGFPRRPTQNLLSIFANQSLVPSELQEKIRFQQGLAEQIAGVIRKIDGVLDAEVRISFPEEDPLNPQANKGKITASVYVKHSGVLDDPNSHLATKIRRLVAASVTGLDFDNVTIIPDRARYGEMNGETSTTYEPEKEFVSLWGVVISKDSVSLFRWLFGLLSIFLLLLILAIVWTAWKLYPILKKYGGYKELLHIKPISLHKEEDHEPSEEKKKSASDDQGDGVT